MQISCLAISFSILKSEKLTMKKQIITAKISPNSKENSIKEEFDLFGNVTYKIKTTAMPRDGKANESLIAIIALHFHIAKRNVKIIKGFSSRTKILEIEI